MNQKVALLPYGKRRLLEIAIAIASRPRVLLLDEPVAGVPEGERREILDTVAALPADVSVLLIEHDMDLVFSFARQVTVLVNGAVLAEGDAAQIAADPRVKAVYLGEARMAELLRVEGLRAGYGEAVVVQGVDCHVWRRASRWRCSAATAPARRRLLNSAGRRDARATPAASGSAATSSPRCAPHRRAAAGIGWVPQERNIFKSLTVDENLDRGRAPRRLDPAARLRDVPAAGRAQGQPRQPAVGRRAADARDGRALVLNPKLLLLDEPLEGLAPIIVEELLRSIARVVRDEGLSAIIVEQNPRLVLPITQRAIVLDRGAVVLEAPSAELLADRARLDRWLAVAKD